MKSNRISKWASGGTPFIWLNAAAVAICLVMVLGLLFILASNGLGHFWPKQVMQGSYSSGLLENVGEPTRFIGEHVRTEQVVSERLRGTGLSLPNADSLHERQLIKFGNRDVTGADFGWLFTEFVSDVEYPPLVTVVERRNWGNFYGYLTGISEQGDSAALTDQPTEQGSLAAAGDAPTGQGALAAAGDVSAEQADEELWSRLQSKLQRVAGLYREIDRLQRREIAQLNYQFEQLRLEARRLELRGEPSPAESESIGDRRTTLETQFNNYQARLNELHALVDQDVAWFSTASGQQIEISLGEIVRVYRPNNVGFGRKLGLYLGKLTEFLTAEPRDANTQGGIFPAIFGTVVMVLLMSVMVTPLGVLAAIYLREYAKQGLVTRLIRIAVNNLAGVPSIVYGVFGLGFFIYLVGGEIDRLFYPEVLPAPTFGTPGLLWASLTLALLTVPVVIVATEEGLARIPRSLREGSLALGATKFETITRVVFPIASPAMITGLILAIARAAGEVAPLMLVGVVKLAPSLPINGIYPYLHLDQKFMHLGYHIYDVGFQSPNVDAARPLVFATALLLVLVIALLNLSAAAIRNRLRDKYQALEG